MSYDLYFKPRPNTAAPTKEAFGDYFRERDSYQVSDKQAIYENEATGVYFIFDLGDIEEEIEKAEPGLAPLSFNLNYFRPHIFGQEAELEVSALIKHFDLLVSDPQIDGMGEGEYSTEKFLQGWNVGNELGYRSILKDQQEQSVFSAPSAKIESAWRWNLMRDRLQAQLGEDVFVPRIMFLSVSGMLQTTVAWGDGIPIAMPEVETVLIPRDQFAPTRFLIRKKDIQMVSWPEILPLIAQFPIPSGPQTYRLLKYDAVPPEIASFVKELNQANSKPEVIPTDRVLDTELVERARANSG